MRSLPLSLRAGASAARRRRLGVAVVTTAAVAAPLVTGLMTGLVTGRGPLPYGGTGALQNTSAPLVAPGSVPIAGSSASGLGPLAVVGDSNSVAPWFTPGWVEMTERLLGYAPGGVLNVSIPGAMAGIHPQLPDDKSGSGLVADVLATGIAFDGVIIALGTNDVLIGRETAEILASLQLLEAQLLADDPDRPVFIALVAPIAEPVEGAAAFEANVQALNAQLESTFGWQRVIDFYSPLADGPLGTEFTLYHDGVHHNALGSALKSAAAVDALAAAFGLTVGMK